MYYNIHTHFKPKLVNEIAIRNSFSHNFEPTQANYFVSVGIHPWLVNANSVHSEIELLKKIAYNHKVIAIGECGLDKNNGAELTIQIEAFKAQIEIANAANKPLILHIVKAYNELLTCVPLTKVPVILHNYKGSMQQTQQFLQFKNVYFSFGSNMVKKPENYIELFNFLPKEKVFLETDNKPILITDVYKSVSLITEKDIAFWEENIALNFKKVFGFN